MTSRQLDITRILVDVLTLPRHRFPLFAGIAIFGVLLPKLALKLFTASLQSNVIFFDAPLILLVLSILGGVFVTSAGLLASRFAMQALSRYAHPIREIISVRFLIAAWPFFALMILPLPAPIDIIFMAVASVFMTLTVPVICVENLSGLPAAVQSAKYVWKNIATVLICLVVILIPGGLVLISALNFAEAGIPPVITASVFFLVEVVSLTYLSAILPVRIYDEIRANR